MILGNETITYREPGQQLPAPIWLRALVALIVAINIISFAGAFNNFQIVSALSGLPVSPVAQLIFSGVFLLAFLLLLVGLQQRRVTALAAAAPLLTIYALSGLAWNLLLTRSTYSQETFGCDSLMTLLILAPVWWTAWRRGWLKPLRSALRIAPMSRS